jgi:hypothetical protein
VGMTHSVTICCLSAPFVAESLSLLLTLHTHTIDAFDPPM